MIRRPVPWPDGAKVAAAITFDMDADSILHLAQPASAHTRVAALSMLQYGPQVAMPRILALFREFGMAQTFFVPAWCIERYPAVELPRSGQSVREGKAALGDLYNLVEVLAHLFQIAQELLTHPVRYVPRHPAYRVYAPQEATSRKTLAALHDDLAEARPAAASEIVARVQHDETDVVQMVRH